MSQTLRDNKNLSIIALTSLALGGGLAFYLYQKKKNKFWFDPEKMTLEDVTVDQCKEILSRVMKSQIVMKNMMSEVLDDLHEKNMSFSQVCKRVDELQPINPLKECNLLMKDFSLLLDLHKDNPLLQPFIQQLTNTNSTNEIRPDLEQIPVKTVIDVHQFMVGELEDILVNLRKTGKKVDGDEEDPVCPFSSRVITISAQAYIAGKVYVKYGLKSQDLEVLVAAYQSELLKNNDFIRLSTDIHHVMSKLLKVSSEQEE